MTCELSSSTEAFRPISIAQKKKKGSFHRFGKLRLLLLALQIKRSRGSPKTRRFSQTFSVPNLGSEVEQLE
jgi:hypothetical protein